MVEVNWSRQLIILGLAAVFAFYWTGKQGLWDALRGSSPWDKDWTDAKQALAKRVSSRYEVVDGTNQRGEKRVVLLSWPKKTGEEKDGSRPIPKVSAELLPILPKPLNPRQLAKERAKAKHTSQFDKKDKKKKGKGYTPPKDPVARLVVHDPELNYLKEMFGKDGKKDSDMLIDPNEAVKEEAGEDDKQAGVGGASDRRNREHSASRGRGGWSRESTHGSGEL